MNHPQLKPLVAVIAVVLACGGAHADTPLSLTTSETLTYDSNLKRDNADKYRDFTSSTGAKVELEKSYGRQNYSVSATMLANRYKNTKLYDNDGYNVNLGMSTTVSTDWLLSARFTAVRQLQSFEDQGLNRYKEIITAKTASGSARYGLYGKWSITGDASQTQTSYDINDQADKKSVRARAGLRFSPTDLLYFDGGVAKTTTDSENAELKALALNDKIDRVDLDMYSQWTVTGYSRVNGRLGWTDEKHENYPARDFSGLTWALTWAFTPAGKVSYSFTADRDTNNEGGQALLGGLVQDSQNRVNTGLSGFMSWAATSKLSVTAGLTYKTFDEKRSRVVVGTDVRSTGSLTGRYRAVSVGASYAPSRSTLFSCDIEAYNRSKSLFGAAYDGDAVSCSAAISIDP